MKNNGSNGVYGLQPFKIDLDFGFIFWFHFLLRQKINPEPEVGITADNKEKIFNINYMEKFEPKKIVCDTCQGSHPTEQHEGSVAWTETKEKIISEAEAKKREEEKEENRRRKAKKAKKESGTCSECGGAHSTRQHSTYEGGFFG